jgi:hypothetical protein
VLRAEEVLDAVVIRCLPFRLRTQGHGSLVRSNRPQQLNKGEEVLSQSLHPNPLVDLDPTILGEHSKVIIGVRGLSQRIRRWDGRWRLSPRNAVAGAMLCHAVDTMREPPNVESQPALARYLGAAGMKALMLTPVVSRIGVNHQIGKDL